MLYRRKEPYFIFPEIPPYEQLTFEKLSLNNFLQFFRMFENDGNPFTDDRFKHYDKAKQYVQDIEEYGAYLPKHGGQDWLFVWNGEYTGILHLYDLSLETCGENNRRCWIGFSTTPKMRNKGITKKAVSYFVRYIFENYPLINYVHAMTLKENLASQNLLRSVGFRQDYINRMSEEHTFYILERKEQRTFW